MYNSHNHICYVVTNKRPLYIYLRLFFFPNFFVSIIDADFDTYPGIFTVSMYQLLVNKLKKIKEKIYLKLYLLNQKNFKL